MERSQLHVEFFTDAREDKKASRAAGRPIYKDVELVRIKFPGDNKRMLVAPANDPSVMDKGSGRHITYAERFPFLEARDPMDATWDVP